MQVKIRSFLRGTIIVLVIVAYSLFLSACGSDRSKPTIQSIFTDSQRKILQVEKLVAAAPSSEISRVNDLRIALVGSEFQASWHYFNLGDYNQDGTVGVSDLTPIAQHFGDNVSAGDTYRNSIEAVIDGSGNGKVGIEDVTQIAMNFGVNVHHYAVEGVDDYTLPYYEIAQTTLSGHENNERLELTDDAGPSPYKYYRVVPIDADGARGIPSNVVSSESGEAPQIISVSPTAGDSGTQATFTATVAGDGPCEYSWDFGGGAAPGTSAEAAPTVTLSSGGTLAQPVRVYGASLSVTTPFGSVNYPFTLNVSAWWHVEDIPKVPGYDVIATADYFYGPDGSLWGRQSYSSPLADSFLLRIANGQLVEHEQIEGSLAVDREDNPAGVHRVKTGFLSYDYYFSRRIDGQWSDGELLESGVTGIKSETFFNSENQPVIVYTKLAGSYELWAARRDEAGTWAKIKIREAGNEILPYSQMAGDDTLRVLYSSADDGGCVYLRLRPDSQTVERSLILENSDSETSGLRYSVKNLAVTPAGAPFGLFTRRDLATGQVTVFTGEETGTGWSYEDVLVLPPTAETGPVGVEALRIAYSSLPVMMLYYFDTGAIALYAKTEGAWAEIPTTIGFPQDSNEPEMLIAPSGDINIRKGDSFAVFF
jgi:hypothetical protein